MVKIEEITKTEIKRSKQPRRAKNQQKKKKDKKSRVPRLAKGMSPREMALAKLLADPCNGPVDAVMTSGNTVAVRVPRIFPVHATAANTTGFFGIWPAFHNNAASGGSFNIIQFEPAPANFTANIANSSTTPLGTDLAVAGAKQYDPVSSLLSDATSGNYQAAATLAACLQAVYKGPTSTNQGMISLLQGVTPQQFLYDAASGGPTISQLELIADKRQRIEPLQEVKWASEQEPKFYGKGVTGGAALAAGAGEAGCFNATASQPTAFTTASMGSHGIIIAWSGLNASQADDLEIKVVKVVEMKLALFSGIMQSSTGNALPTNTFYQKAVNYLDKAVPGWRTALVKNAGNMAMRALGTAADYVLGGMSPAVGAGRLAIGY
jgi:hypothetical protein